MDRKSNIWRPPLWADTFDNYNESRAAGGLRMAYNERNNIPMNNISHEDDIDDNSDNLDENYFDNVVFDRNAEPNGEQEEEESPDISYTNRVHSIHRNRLYNPHNNITQSLEARVGDVNWKNMDVDENDGGLLDPIENHASLIVAKMEQDPALMEDSPTSEQLRIETLRDMPQNLTLKRRVKVKLSKSVSQKSKRKPLSYYKMFKYRMSIAISKFKLDFKNLAYTFELWYASVKLIEGNFGSGVASFFKFLRWIFIMDVFVALVSFAFIVVPQLTFDSRDVMNFQDFDWTDILSGEGYLTNTFLYYGFYANGTDTSSYSMPHAYFFTMVCLYLCCFAVLSISVAGSYRRSFIETEGGLKNVYAHKIFCGWDYNIATEDAANLKSNAIYNELKELLYEDMRQSGKDTCMVIFWSRMMQATMNLFILVCLAVTGYVMWYFMDKASTEHWQSIYTAIIVNTIMTVFPIIFSCVVKYEGYKSPRTALYFTLIRTFVLGFVVIGVSVTFWLKNPENECWETSLGQEIYRLVLFDFLFSVLLTPILDLLWSGLCRLFDLKEHLHFDIARNTMQVIYNQTLLWVGLFFSPFLAVIVMLKLLVMWYVRKLVVVRFCKPPAKSWRAAQATTWFLMMAFLSLLLIMGLMGYIITIPTTSCGPFSEYDYIYELVTMGVLHLRENGDVWNIVLFVTRPGFIALVIIALCGRVYYLRAKANAQRGIVALYRDMLVWETRDKEFLLQNISLITNGRNDRRTNIIRNPTRCSTLC
ncbi:hypothetical protein NQ318_022506 [Aromia moschata]|uniref:TMC domain-containing protein n=1 Tax=Aromia moschata TaxID=1265417 RepID=A0AAV8Z6Y3_9CUCU|nr:hypothetical protein NQ318_022506 [Aromia moschata]